MNYIERYKVLGTDMLSKSKVSGDVWERRGNEYLKTAGLAKDFCDKFFDGRFDRNRWIKEHAGAVPMDKLRKLIMDEFKGRMNPKYWFKVRMELFGCFTVFGKKSQLVN